MDDNKVSAEIANGPGSGNVTVDNENLKGDKSMNVSPTSGDPSFASDVVSTDSSMFRI